MKRFEMTCNAVAKEQTIIGNGYRLSVLSPTILRVELSKTNSFLDKPSQMAICRDYGATEFKSSETEKTIVIETSLNIFSFNKNSKKVSVVRKDNITTDNEMSKQVPTKLSSCGNLGGTRRTIDFRLGAIPLGKGLMAKGGLRVVDDSKNFVINPDGTLSPREKGTKDFYVFAFGEDYRSGLIEFFKLTGFPPVLPKYALGNWWSRYYPYSEKTYLALMDKFAENQVPLTVATIDMDWHWVKEVPKEFGSGWTGYSWNTALFPDYKRFLKELKARGLAVTLNIHPADGVRAFEDMYEDMALATEVDASQKLPIKFDLSNPKFLDAYFKVLHHPYEKAGVDFWWIDWQQGKSSTVKGLDPLWLLNHYHTLDINRPKSKGIILSRYAKLGSHRYPLGFSGDCIMAWKSLKFQPHFTATASNVGYTWWSHDIGGHVFGRGDDELYLRWLEWGVFSPINRLHSVSGPFMGKEPWLYRDDIAGYAKNFLRLRHKMLPYLYTANIKTAKNGAPLISPMYYNISESDNKKLVYKSKASYYFGSELVVAPITTKLKSKFNRAGVKFYLPKGEWTDIFTAQKYSGGKNVKLFRKLETIPALAKAGAIIPMLKDNTSNSQSFEKIEIWAYKGDGSYTMYDDNGASILFSQESCKDNSTFKVSQPSGKLATKTVNILFKDITSAKIVVDGVSKGVGNSVEIEVGTAHTVELSKITYPTRKDFLSEIEDIMQDYHIFTPIRQLMFIMIKRAKTKQEASKMVRFMPLRKDVKGTLKEILDLEN